mmetsp:Transcript_37793/g.90787  ORF Transcript_37793/g.90787 Transcript_37793/m.90787 type:complete len:348 (+) Transcript_37793:23-1066(+)
MSDSESSPHAPTPRLSTGSESDSQQDVSVGGSAGEGQWPVGTLVVLRGLQSKPEYNGHVGRIMGWSGNRAEVFLHFAAWSGRRATAVGVKPQASNLSVVKLAPLRQKTAVMGTVHPPMVQALLGERGRGLDVGLVEHVISFLLVSGFDPDKLEVVGASSDRGDYDLSEALTRNTTTWWISGDGNFRAGSGEEYLEFKVGDVPTRVSVIGIKIPPMPAGPLSVRKFRVDVLVDPAVQQGPTGAGKGSGGNDPQAPAAAPGKGQGKGGYGRQRFTPVEATAEGQERGPDPGWETVLRAETLDVGHLQELAFDRPVDTTRVRLVCLTNAAMGRAEGHFMHCVGLFQVAIR